MGDTYIDDSAWGKLFCFVMTLDDGRLAQTHWSSERVGQSWFWWPLSVGFARTWRAGCRWWQNDWEPFGWTASASYCCWWSLGAIAEKRPRALEAHPPNFNSPLDGCSITQRPRLILCGTLVPEWAYDWLKKIRFVSRWLCAALKSSKVGLQVACLTAATQEAPAGGGTCA